jgi:hypothetical protein
METKLNTNKVLFNKLNRYFKDNIKILESWPVQRTRKYNTFLASHSQCSAGSRLRLGGPEPVSLKKFLSCI